MARRHKAEKREVNPDPKFGDAVVSKFMNSIMKEGKKSVAENIVYGALDRMQSRAKSDPIQLFHSALENVMMPQMIRGLTKQEARKRAAELLSYLGLKERLTHRPAELSGGEQQRVAIARALANDPGLILADEPTGNLDDETARNVIALLCRSCRERRKSLLLVSHDRHVTQEADAIFELRAGVLMGTERGQAT